MTDLSSTGVANTGFAAPSHAIKVGHPDYPIHEAHVERWSPYAFAGRPVSQEDLQALFEAARWSASSYNEQPWRYIVATKSEPEFFAQVLSCLMDMNQVWAKAAPVLAIGCVSLNFTHNGKPNSVAVHDLGAASANLTTEATLRGIQVHQMAGIVPARVRELFHVPENFWPVTGIAIGYAADPAALPDGYRQRDEAPRTRNPLSKFVFGPEWDKPASVVG